jgi:hypothetical protein
MLSYFLFKSICFLEKKLLYLLDKKFSGIDNTLMKKWV